MIYNKLVRDKIPKIIKKTNGHYTYKVLSLTEYDQELRKKVIEEAKELSNAFSNEDLVYEIADILEVIDAIKQKYQISDELVEKVKKKKALEKGKFEERLFLIEVKK